MGTGVGSHYFWGGCCALRRTSFIDKLRVSNLACRVRPMSSSAERTGRFGARDCHKNRFAIASVRGQPRMAWVRGWPRTHPIRGASEKSLDVELKDRRDAYGPVIVVATVVGPGEWIIADAILYSLTVTTVTVGGPWRSCTSRSTSSGPLLALVFLCSLSSLLLVLQCPVNPSEASPRWFPQVYAEPKQAPRSSKPGSQQWETLT